MSIKSWFKCSVMTLMAATLLQTSCTSDHNKLTDDFEDIQQQALDSIMLHNYPDAYRQTGGFYIEEVDMTNSYGAASNSFANGWVRYNILSKTMNGEICNTRDQDIARQLGTFSYRTRYAPVMQYVSTTGDNPDYIDMLFQNKDIKMGGTSIGIYASDHFNVYVPSEILGSGANGSNGYAGQKSITANEFMASEIEVIEVFEDAWERELDEVLDFMETNELSDWTRVSHRIDEDDETEEDDMSDENYYDYDDTDSKIYVYYDSDYTPHTKYNFKEQYNYSYLPFVTVEAPNATYFDQLQSDIAEAVVERFGEGNDNEGRIVPTDEFAKIWYIARTLDGFIVDTNIDEVAELAFADRTGGYSCINYKCDTNADSFIDAWYYAIQDLRYGEWATFITPSKYAYSYSGSTGSKDKTEIQPYTPMLFSIYIEKE